MAETRVLYAYFGNLGIFNEDIPGHSFYQIGLLDAIREREGEDCKFDFYSYLPVPEKQETLFPDDEIGLLNEKYFLDMIADYRPAFDKIIDQIRMGRYQAIYLKARFRNLSTLAKGFNDAWQFEQLIKEAAGVPDLKIYVLDTDLSLPDEFLESAGEYGVKRLIPSIDMPGIGANFLKDCMDIHKKQLIKANNAVIYYGNLDFKNYKVGHEKNPIIIDLLSKLSTHKKFNTEGFSVTHAGKPVELLQAAIKSIHRSDRESIWNSFGQSKASINISKDLYLERGFLPARVFEAIMFGTVTVSFADKTLHPSFGFTSVEQAIEQITYLSEIEAADYLKILESQAEAIYLRGRHSNK